MMTMNVNDTDMVSALTRAAQLFPALQRANEQLRAENRELRDRVALLERQLASIPANTHDDSEADRLLRQLSDIQSAAGVDDTQIIPPADNVSEDAALAMLEHCKSLRHDASNEFRGHRTSEAVAKFAEAKTQLEFLVTKLRASETCSSLIDEKLEQELVSLLASHIQVLTHVNDLSLARSEMTRLLSLKPAWHRTHALNGSLLLAESKPNDAVKAFDLALSLHPNDRDRAKIVARKSAITTSGTSIEKGLTVPRSPDSITSKMSPAPSPARSLVPFLASSRPPLQRVDHPHTHTNNVSGSQPGTVSHDWSIFPRVTQEGLVDFLGHQCYAESEHESSIVTAIKVRHFANTGAGRVVLYALCRHTGTKKRKRDADNNTENAINMTPMTGGQLTVTIEFHGSTVHDWQCQCDGARAHPSVPCYHVGAALLQLKSKQSALTLPASHPSLFVHNEFALSVSEWMRSAELDNKYSNLSVKSLQSLLSSNGLSTSGHKSLLVARCIEANVRGVPVPCRECGGRVFYCNGEYHCKGRFDATSKRVLLCEFRSKLWPTKPWIES